MRVTGQSNNYRQAKQQNFTSVNLIKVARGAEEFKGLSLSQIEKTFTGHTVQITTGIYAGIVDILHRFKLIRPKTEVYLETPFYAQIAAATKKLSPKQPLKSPLDSNYHSFYVYTGEQAEQFRKFVDSNPQEVRSLKQDAGSKFALRDFSLKELRRAVEAKRNMMAYYYEKLDLIVGKKFEEIRRGQPVNTFTINSLSELPGVFKTIDK